MSAQATFSCWSGFTTNVDQWHRQVGVRSVHAIGFRVNHHFGVTVVSSDQTLAANFTQGFNHATD